MSVLLDKLVKESMESPTYGEKDLKWYFAKPILSTTIKARFKRLKDAIRVLNGKSFAVHYKDDE